MVLPWHHAEGHISSDQSARVRLVQTHGVEDIRRHAGLD
jgi:hypothetical protein